MEVKTCSKCGQEKSVDQYTRAQYSKDGLNWQCKECCRVHRKKYLRSEKGKARHKVAAARYWARKHLTKHWGATEDEVREFRNDCEVQKGRCAICKEVSIRKGKIQLEYDHNHRTGRYRGAICGKCNRALGAFREDIQILETLIEYLKQS